jgi:hypothetical protein
MVTTLKWRNIYNMKWNTITRQTRLSIIAAVILLTGLGSAVLIYLTAEDESDNLMIYEFEQSKMYRHDLELYGGKLNVLTSEFMHWFDALWHGKSLAFTIAFIAVFISCAIILAARLFPPDHDSTPRGPRAP